MVQEALKTFTSVREKFGLDLQEDGK